MTNLVSLHILVEKDDLMLIDAFSPNHGDRTKLCRHILHVFCDDLRKGDQLILPPEIQYQLKKHEDTVIKESDETDTD